MEKVDVVRLIDMETNKEILMFDVKLVNELDEETTLGSYSISEEGVLTGEVDQLLILYSPDVIENAKTIILRNGLQEIIGPNTTEDIFSHDGFSISSNIAFQDDSNRWKRAMNFIERNHLDVEKMEIDSFGTEYNHIQLKKN